jgi:hypothetical protein
MSNIFRTNLTASDVGLVSEPVRVNRRGKETWEVLGSLVAKFGRWVAMLGRCVAKWGIDGWLNWGDGWLSGIDEWLREEMRG